MRTLLIHALVLAVSVLAVIRAQAKDTQQSAMAEIKGERFGESLKKFRSRHPQASCHRRPNQDSEDNKKSEWLAWVDCGLDKRATAPLGSFAIFHNNKLIEIGYTLDAKSIDAVLRFMFERGKPLRSSFTKDNEFQSATWVDETGVATTIEIVTLPPVTVEGQFLRIGKGTETRGIQMRFA
jgi:hypothetical protein